MATIKSLHTQLAHLCTRVSQIRTLPIYTQALTVPEIVTLQLGLLGDIIEAIETLETLQKEKSP